MTRGVYPPFPPQRTLGTQSRSAKQCRRTPWRPGIAPWTPKGPPGTPHGSSEGTLGPQWPVEKTLMSHFDSPTSDLAPLQSNFARSGEAKCYKNQRYFNDFENALFVSISVFFIPRRPKGSSETPFRERSGDFGVPRAPLEIGNGPPWAPWAAPRAPFRLLHIDLLRKKSRAEPT